MRKIVMLNRVSIDGFFASNNEMTGGMDWFVQDPEVDKAVRAFGAAPADTLILGANTYTFFQHSWMPMLQDPNVPAMLKAIAEELTAMHKVVFSHRLTQSPWANSRFINGDIENVVRDLKQQLGGEIMIFGSGSIVQQLTNAKLIDEYIFIVSPVIAGQGKTLFKDVIQRDVVLISAQPFASGNIVLRYALKS